MVPSSSMEAMLRNRAEQSVSESFEDKVVISYFFDVGFNLPVTDSNGFVHHLTLENEKPRVLVRLGIFHVLFLYHQFTQCLRKIVQIF